MIQWSGRNAIDSILVSVSIFSGAVMPIRFYKPTSPGRRGASVSDFSEVTKTKPEKSLVERISRKNEQQISGRTENNRVVNFNGEAKLMSTSGSTKFFWNDKISSIQVPQGWKIILYEHENFGGRSLTLTSDWTVRAWNDFWNDRISSIRVIPPSYGSW